MNEETYRESLKEEAENIEREARMVVPGVQALLGFQFVAVLNERFTQFSHEEQWLHWLALLAVATSAALVMAPAAERRNFHRGVITRKFVNRASRWLEHSMRFLGLGISLEIYLVGRMVTDHQEFSLAGAFLAALIFFWFWYLGPRWRRI